MKKIILPFLVLFLLLESKASPTNPQIKSRTITGVVTSAEDGLPISGALVTVLPNKKFTSTNVDGKFSIAIDDNARQLSVSYIGYQTQVIKLSKSNHFIIKMTSSNQALQEVIVREPSPIMYRKELADANIKAKPLMGHSFAPVPVNRESESYATINENGFHHAIKEPLSTFSIDVDAASYSNVRRMINNGSLPPKDAVRIEEMINYFDYDYAQPKGDDPVNIVTGLGNAPWNPLHKLVQIGLKAKTISTDHLPASNLVFLIDVSGSMSAPNKLPLLVSSLKLLTDQLRAKDRVAIVVYAGNAGLVLPSTSGDAKTTIKDALNKLAAGGSTAGGAGLQLAYQVATENLIKGGNNRIILATDGDFNVGQHSDDEMKNMIEAKRKTGIFLTVLGYGMGNYKDSKMEILANKGNGNYAYIDNINEARKVLVNEFGGTLFTIAKDVKLQVEFNPAKVQAYRLIGYENRLLQKEDFNNDTKDAGEMGSGHTVTALYEIIPVGVKSNFSGSVDDLKYQQVPKQAQTYSGNEMLTIKLRYKQPDGEVSKRIEKVLMDTEKNSTNENYLFAAAVAEFGMLLRDSDFKQQSNFNQVIELANASIGKDSEGYRAEFLKLVKSTQLMAKDLLTIAKKE